MHASSGFVQERICHVSDYPSIADLYPDAPEYQIVVGTNGEGKMILGCVNSVDERVGY